MTCENVLLTEQLLVIVTVPGAFDRPQPRTFSTLPSSAASLCRRGQRGGGGEAAWGEAALEGAETETGTQGGGRGAGTQEVRSGGRWRQVEVDIYTEIGSLPPSITPTLPEGPSGSCRPRPTWKPSG